MKDQNGECHAIRIYFLLKTFVENQLEDLSVDKSTKIILKLLMSEI